MITLDKISPIEYQNTWLLPLNVKISKLFGTNKIQFQISIKDKKIVIESPKILADLDIQDNDLLQEAINV